MLEESYRVGPPNVEQSRRLFNNRVRLEKIHLTKKLMAEKVDPYWDTCKESWWYDRYGFRLGKDNAGIKPQLIPFIYDMIFSPGPDYHLITLQELLRIALDNFDQFTIVNTENNPVEVLIGRLQQSYANLFRELHVPRHMMDKVGKIEKIYHLDLEHGVDFAVDEVYPIAVKHDGATTDAYDASRKDKKNIPGIRTFWSARSWNSGIHMLDPNDMNKYLVEREKFKNLNLPCSPCAFC